MSSESANPMTQLMHSRKFLLLVLDVLISVALYFVGRYYPAMMDDVKFLVVTLQPVIVVVIGAIAYEDAKKIDANTHVVIAQMGHEYETQKKEHN